MNSNRTNQHIESADETVGTFVSITTVEKIYDLFLVRGKSGRYIRKYLGLRQQHIESALRCKMIQLREAGLPRSGFGKPIQRAVVSMPARNRGVAA